MANQETFLANAAESTLSSSLTSGATTVNVTSTTGFPSVNFYAVIDPADDSKREVVLATAKTATSLTVTRAQDGTSGVAHDSGAVIAVVPVAALWTDINDRVEGHDHSGGTAGTAIATGDLTGHTKAAHDALSLDHGSLSGLTDVADHPQYLQASGQAYNNPSTQSVPAGTETTLDIPSSSWMTNCTLASDTLTVGASGLFRLYAYARFTSSSVATSATLRVKKNGTLLASTVDGSPVTTTTLEYGENSVWAGFGEIRHTLADGDSLTLTLELVGGSGHTVDGVLLAVERVA